jgi:hypothetical protein
MDMRADQVFAINRAIAARHCSTTFEQRYLRFLGPSPCLDNARLEDGASPTVA